ncbi:MAG: hypothetical protein DLM57_07020 [Pseudonocardiales bacterium]|nr:MAG: hypothetical protein DLM57_07020 [Pseudonocardiales bacterium]
MIWLAWRQFRTQAAVVFGALATLAVVLVVTGLRLRHLYDTSGITTCSATGDCDTVAQAFAAQYSWLQTLVGKILLLLLPAIAGVFWGAPLIARELDTGTYRLAWTQSVTRTRWLAAKIAVVGLASVVASGLLSLMVTWWFSPLDKVSKSRFAPSVFQVRDIVPIGYAAFGFAFGLTAGLLIRRTLPAMATTLVAYIAARAVVLIWIRPHLQAPLHATIALHQSGSPDGVGVRLPGASAIHPGDWMVSAQLLDPAGRPTNVIRFSAQDGCAGTHTCLNGYHQALTYQPANRYWPFQWYETGLFLGSALLLIGFCFWWITDHRAPTTHHSSSAAQPNTPAPNPSHPRPRPDDPQRVETVQPVGRLSDVN